MILVTQGLNTSDASVAYLLLHGLGINSTPPPVPTIDTHDGATPDEIRRYREKLQRLANARDQFNEPSQINSVEIKIAQTENVVYTEPQNYDLELLLLMSSL